MSITEAFGGGRAQANTASITNPQIPQFQTTADPVVAGQQQAVAQGIGQIADRSQRHSEVMANTALKGTEMMTEGINQASRNITAIGMQATELRARNQWIENARKAQLADRDWTRKENLAAEDYANFLNKGVEGDQVFDRSGSWVTPLLADDEASRAVLLDLAMLARTENMYNSYLSSVAKQGARAGLGGSNTLRTSTAREIGKLVVQANETAKARETTFGRDPAGELTKVVESVEALPRGMTGYIDTLQATGNEVGAAMLHKVATALGGNPPTATQPAEDGVGTLSVGLPAAQVAGVVDFLNREAASLRYSLPTLAGQPAALEGAHKFLDTVETINRNYQASGLGSELGTLEAYGYADSLARTQGFGSLEQAVASGRAADVARVIQADIEKGRAVNRQLPFDELRRLEGPEKEALLLERDSILEAGRRARRRGDPAALEAAQVRMTAWQQSVRAWGQKHRALIEPIGVGKLRARLGIPETSTSATSTSATRPAQATEAFSEDWGD